MCTAHSLSWSFKFIGAQSTVATLWQVDDRSTAGILKDFYERILAGENKAEALSAAKRNYLKQVRTSEEAHPFYWAGLVLGGNDVPLALTPTLTSNYWALIVGVFLVLIVGYIAWRVKLF